MKASHKVTRETPGACPPRQGQPPSLRASRAAYERVLVELGRAPTSARVPLRAALAEMALLDDSARTTAVRLLRRFAALDEQSVLRLGYWFGAFVKPDGAVPLEAAFVVRGRSRKFRETSIDNELSSEGSEQVVQGRESHPLVIAGTGQIPAENRRPASEEL